MYHVTDFYVDFSYSLGEEEGDEVSYNGKLFIIYSPQYYLQYVSLINTRLLSDENINPYRWSRE